MNPKQRLQSTFKGQSVDRPPVNFYEIGGFLVETIDPDSFNIYNSPSWKPLIDLAEKHTDIIRMMSPVRQQSHLAWEHSSNNKAIEKYVSVDNWEEGDSKFSRLSYRIGNKTLSSVTRQDRQLDTVWTIEYLIKSQEDVLAYLELPDEVFAEEIDCKPLLEEEMRLGDHGIVMVDTEDPICAVAGLFPMEEFALFAFTKPDLCDQLLQKHARIIHDRTKKVSRLFPGHLWRIYGSEYVTPPFLPVYLFEDFVVKYDAPMIDAIHQNGGYARVHCHGNINEVMPAIVGMGADAIDPLEPPPQGNLELSAARRLYGDKLVLFGNIEVTDIENMPSDQFRKTVQKSIQDGSSGSGRGFVLMPSASPYGREISEQTMTNYRIMVEEVQRR